jgi:hypothetical protein
VAGSAEGLDTVIGQVIVCPGVTFCTNMAFVTVRLGVAAKTGSVVKANVKANIAITTTMITGLFQRNFRIDFNLFYRPYCSGGFE